MFPKAIDLTWVFSASECSDLGLVSEICYVLFKLHVNNPAFAQHKNSSNVKGFL